ncbi:MAG: O-antigen ligase family protein [Oceanospirillaceae bacterium]
MKFEVKVSTLVTLFTILGLCFFSGVVSFLDRVILGSVGGLETDAAGNLVKKVIGVMLLSTCLFYSIRYKLILNQHFIKDNIWIIFFTLYVLSSFLWSVDSGTTVRRSIFLITVVFFAGYLTRYYDITIIFKYIGYLIAFTAFLGLIRAAVSPSEAFIVGGSREGAFLGIHFDKNTGARVNLLGIMLLLPAIFSNNKRALYAASLCIICIFLARSSSAILLLVIGVSTFLYFNKLSISSSTLANKNRYWGSILVYVLAIFIAYQAYEFILELVGRDASLTDRKLIWELLTPLIQEKIILGYGYGAFWASFGADEFIERWGYIGNAHNGYLEMLLHGGIPLLIIFIIMTIKGFVGSINNAAKSVYSKEYNVAISIIIICLISNYVGYTLPNHTSFDFFVFMLIIFYANKK